MQFNADAEWWCDATGNIGRHMMSGVNVNVDLPCFRLQPHPPPNFKRRYLCQCYCQGLKTQGRGQGQGVKLLGRGLEKDPQRQGLSSRTTTLLWGSTVRSTWTWTWPGHNDTQSLQCRTMVLDISHATLAYSILDNFWGLELTRTRTKTKTRTRTRSWKSSRISTFLKDNNTDAQGPKNYSNRSVWRSSLETFYCGSSLVVISRPSLGASLSVAPRPSGASDFLETE